MNNLKIPKNIQLERVIEENTSELLLYTRKSETELNELLKNAMTNRNIEWSFLSQESALNFHRLTEHTTYCLVKWNSEERYQNMIHYITEFCRVKGGKVLDFGGGIGELSIDLCTSGVDVDYMEVPSNTFNYAKWRFKRRFLEIDSYNSLNQIKIQYDIIVCLDVLEVLEKPLSHLQKFYQLLNPNGLLIFNVGQVGLVEHPMNLDSNKEVLDNIDNYCTEIGFIETEFENKFNLKIKTKKN